jgi:hypothetical protein
LTGSLKFVIETFTDFECTDPLDCVYGLQSLVQRHERIDVDYSKSMEDMFADVMQMVKNLDSLPSWSPRHWDLFEKHLRYNWK